eukprot:6180029-Pleurochrysis_carterae.AAC.4
MPTLCTVTSERGRSHGVLTHKQLVFTLDEAEGRESSRTTMIKVAWQLDTMEMRTRKISSNDVPRLQARQAHVRLRNKEGESTSGKRPGSMFTGCLSSASWASDASKD